MTVKKKYIKSNTFYFITFTCFHIRPKSYNRVQSFDIGRFSFDRSKEKLGKRKISRQTGARFYDLGEKSKCRIFHYAEVMS